MEAIRDQIYTISLPFFIGGEYVSPDNNQITYTIYNNAGQAISGYTNVAANVTGSYFSLAVPANINTIANGLDFERRTVVMQFNYLGQNQRVQKNYLVTDFYPISVTPEKVISYIGLKEGEVFPEDLEITLAIFDIKQALGDTVFTTNLTSGDYNNILLNDAIKYQTAFRLMSSMQLRTMQKAGSESVGFSRFEKMDFDRILDMVKSDLASALLQVSGGGTGAFEVLTLSNPQDIFTG